MSDHSIVYASKCMIPPAQLTAAIDDIVTGSRRRNAALGVTGLLLFSERHFAQALEGSKEALDALMLSITRDSRHSHITILEDAPLPQRRFAGWSLGYAGASVAVDQLIARAVYETTTISRRGLQELLGLMTKFAARAPE